MTITCFIRYKLDHSSLVQQDSTSGGVIASCPGQNGQCSWPRIALAVLCMNSSGLLTSPATGNPLA